VGAVTCRCRALSSCSSGLRCNRQLSVDILRSRETPPFTLTRRKCSDDDVDGGCDPNPTPDWSPIKIHSIYAATAVSTIFVGASTFGHVELANALDDPQLSTLQHGQEVGSSRNSVRVSFQSFFRSDTALTLTPAKSRDMKLIKQHSTLLSSVQNPGGARAEIPGAVANKNTPPTQQTAIKDIPSEKKQQAKQQIIVDKPVASENASPSSVARQQTQAKPPTTSAQLQAIDVKKIATENKIDVELICPDGQRPIDSSAPIVKIDRETFEKVKIYQPPFLRYMPSSVQPLILRQFQSLKVLKSIPDDQLFVASVAAGSLTEIIRTSLLYPLSTVKARVQARTMSQSTAGQKRPLLRKLRVTWLTFVHETKRGDWYAGIVPSLLITVPASGVYSGLKEVSRRAFAMAISLGVFRNFFPEDGEVSSYYSAVVVNLLAAFIADIGALAIRTPADVLALRLQVFGDKNIRSDFTEWAKDSWALLPAMIITDIPFLLSRIFLNAAITTSGENLGQYEFETITIACLCAFLTTPFDVARTRILLPALPSEEGTKENDDPLAQSPNDYQRRRLVAPSKYREQRRQKVSVLVTMREISSEGNGGVQNLYAGWLERTAFLGVGRAWLDPLRVIGYLGIRDALLLKLFE